MPTLDARRLEDKHLAAATRIFHEFKHQRMLLFNEANRDPVRWLLDRRLLTGVNPWNWTVRVRKVWQGSVVILKEEKGPCHEETTELQPGVQEAGGGGTG